ncbi:MAG: monovalent cation/H(+) antiporter subunit G [Bacillus sp. (in: Bacteria)]|nr:monovalent cation/H(+) antiporter subunit G [Bacillus sp. (in: firmicutes)]
MIEIVISILILIGGGLSLLGAVGIIRFPDVYGRLHAATKSATLGVISIILGVFIYFYFIEGIFAGKLLLTILFVFLTAPVAGFMISKSAYNVGVPLWEKSLQDDLGREIKKQSKRQKQQ